MNKIIIIGNLAADPEAHTTQGGILRSTMRVAVNRPYKREETDFLTVIAWRRDAEFCNKYLRKGAKIAVEGCVQVRSYDAQDGSKRTVTEIIADHVEALGGRNDGERPAAEVPEAPQAPGQFVEVEDDQLPFE